MKKLTIIFILLMTAVKFTNAQNPNGKMPTPKEMATASTEFLSSKLKFTAVQKTKVTSILTSFNEQMVKVISANKNNPKAIAPVANKLRAETETKISAVLTPEQRKEFLKQISNQQQQQRRQ